MTPPVNLTEAELDRVEARALVMARETADLRAALIAMRRRKGMTQQDVADLLDVSQQQIAKLGRYDTDVRFSTLERYANAIDAIITHNIIQDHGESLDMANQSEWVPMATSVSAPFKVASHSWQPSVWAAFEGVS